MKIFVVLPAYNEEQSIQRLLPEIDSVLTESGDNYHLIVTDDGSTDATNRLLREASQIYPMHLITHSLNRGLGESSRDNFEAAANLSSECDIIVRRSPVSVVALTVLCAGTAPDPWPPSPSPRLLQQVI